MFKDGGGEIQEKTSIEGMDMVKKLMSAGTRRRAWLVYELPWNEDPAGFSVYRTFDSLPRLALAEIERVKDVGGGTRQFGFRYFDVYLKDGHALANVVYAKTVNGRRRLCFNPWFSIAYSADDVLRWYGKKCAKSASRARVGGALEIMDLNLTALGLGHGDRVRGECPVSGTITA